MRRMLRPLACLLLALLLPLGAAAAGPVAGVDYVEITGGARWSAADNRIEVAEVFAYGCHFCAEFEPKLAAWKRTLPKDVRFQRVPLSHGDEDAFARAYFAAEAAGVLDRTHAAIFRALHDEQALPRNPSVDELAAFYGGLGLDAARFRAAMLGFDVSSKLRPAREFALRNGVEGTPTLIVNGRYRVTARTLDAALQTANALIARERAKEAKKGSE